MINRGDLSLRVDKEIGSGAFAKVFVGELRGAKHEERVRRSAKFLDTYECTVVAVKQANDRSDEAG